MHGGAWWAAVYGVVQSRTRLKRLSSRASQVVLVVKNLPVSAGVRSLGREDPLEEETTTHSSILAWKIPWTEEPGRLQSVEPQRVRTEHDATIPLKFHIVLLFCRK